MSAPSQAEEMLKLARGYELAGHYDDAARMFAKAGHLEDAARLLSGQRKFKEAGDLLMQSLGCTPETVKSLPVEQRKHAFHAAICYGRAQAIEPAVQIFLALKENQRAAELLERSGDRVGAARILAAGNQKIGGSYGVVGRSSVGGQPVNLQSAQKLEQMGKPELALEIYAQLKRYGDAARICDALGRTADAAMFYADGGFTWEAGRAYSAVGDTGKAIENWVRVPKNHPNYRLAAQDVVRFARAVETFDVQMEVFLGKFVEGGPKDAREVETFYLLGKLYEKHDLMENAKEVLRHILKVSPGYRDVAAWLKQLEQDTAGVVRDFDRVVRQDEAFRNAGRVSSVASTASDLPGLPDLPSLPSLPSLPPPPGTSAPQPTIRPSSPSSMTGRPASATQPVATDTEDWNSGTAVRIPTGELLNPGSPATQPMPKAPRRELATGPDLQTLLGGRYRVIQQIGKGGMATVYRVEDIELSEEVALKLFLAGDDDANGLTRFRQELKLSRNLIHPNIVRLYDIGVHEGSRYITMELLSGRDLHAFMGKPMALGVGLNYLMQACAGLYQAHQAGVVHRDIKPENLFITDKGVLKVMDFGIAKGQVRTGMTMDGLTAGTPKYISPEQINSFSAVTGATDLYALGVVAYEMFTGQAPFDSPELMRLFMMHMSESPRPPRELNPQIPPELEAIILKLLQKKPEDRFGDARALAAALDPLRRRFQQ